MSAVNPEVQESRRLASVAELAPRRSTGEAWARFAQAHSPEDFCANWLLIQCEAVGGVSDGVVLLQPPGTSEYVPVAFHPEVPRDRTLLVEVSERALKEGRGVVLPRESASAPNQPAGSPRYQLAYPIRVDGSLRGAIALDIDWRAEPQLQLAMRELQWGSGWLEVLLRRHADPGEAAQLRLKLAMDLMGTLLRQRSLKDSAAAFATEVATRLGCDRVALGVVKGGRVRLCAVSHSAQFDERANLLRAIEAAMEESVDQTERVVSPPPRENLPVVAHAHEVLLRESGAGSAATFPLVSDGEVIGALSLERGSGQRFDPQTLELCEALVSVAGPVVDLKRRSEENLALHAAHSTKRLWDKLAGPGYPGWKLGAAGGLAAAAFISFATGTFRVSADVTVEGLMQRAITAPFNGYVKEAALRAGDIVKAGQEIGRFDDRELQLERIKLASQRQQLSRQHREALAKHERAQGEVIGAQLEQTEAQLALVEEQLSRVAMVAPLDGVIVSGDLSQLRGTPVERGQVLFELAPLDGYRVVLRVDERDIGYVAVGQQGELAVTAMPRESFAFTVTSIVPVNLAQEGRNVFRVEARLDAGTGRLRPGMTGVGKIHIEERNLAWIWTRSAADWLRLKFWALLP